MMTVRGTGHPQAAATPVRTDDPTDRIRSSAQAERTLPDSAYLAYCLVAACKHFVAMACKRWPELR